MPCLETLFSADCNWGQADLGSGPEHRFFYVQSFPHGAQHMHREAGSRSPQRRAGPCDQR